MGGMGTARPLREIFGELAGADDRAGTDPAVLLARSGHPGLPEELVAQAVAGFAETARPEIAEHLAPYVMANSPIPGPDDDPGEVPMPWLDLLVTAPPVAEGEDPPEWSDPGTDPGDTLDPLDPAPELPADQHGAGAWDQPDPASLDFGAGPEHEAPDGFAPAPEPYDVPAHAPDWHFPPGADELGPDEFEGPEDDPDPDPEDLFG